MNLLHLDASITGVNSISRRISAAVVERLRDATPGLVVSYRDLAAEPLPHLGLAQLPSDHPGSAMAPEPDAAASAASQAVLEQFLAADVVVIGAPMYNFTIPSQLKAWIDRIAVPGTTFKYDGATIEGLAAGKRVIIALSRGGLYGIETPMAAFEHVERYLRSIFGFIGVEPEFILAEGINLPDNRQPSLDAALQTVADLKAD